MNRRTQLKLEKARLISKKYIFSTRYLVRNTLAVLIVGSVVGTATIAAKTVDFSEGRGEEVVEARGTEEELVLVNDAEIKYEINLDDSAIIEEHTIVELASRIDEQETLEISANESENLTKSLYDMDGKFIANTDGLNVRVEASEDAEIVGTLSKGAAGDVVEVSDESEASEDWTKISSGDVEGYVKTEFILTDDEATEVAEESAVSVATISATDVNVRSSSSESADIMIVAYQGDSFTVNDENTGDEWTNIKLADGTYGYVKTEFVSVETGFEEAVSQEELSYVLDAKKAKEAERQAEIEAEAAAKKQNNTVGASTSNEKAASATVEATTAAATEATTEAATEATTAAPVEASSSDLYLLAAIVYAESGGESYEGQLAVASVVLNRLNNGYWGSSISSVIYAPGQFAGANTSSFATALTTGGSATSLQAAQDALNGSNNVPGCLYFRPTWNIDTSTLSSYTQIGNHIFY